MRRYFLFAFILTATLSCYWVWQHRPEIRNQIQSYIENKEFLTLETRYSPDEILKAYPYTVKTYSGDHFNDPYLRFYPYLMMEVNFVSSERKIHEGVVLWSMTEGEMVTDANNWNMTHGFEACLIAQATRADFKIMNALARHGGQATRQHIMKEMRLDSRTVEPWIQSAFRKNLIIQNGKALTLHFKDANFYVPPLTRVSDWLVTRPYMHAYRASEKYTQKQIVKIARAAFGKEFNIKNTKVVYVPIYTVDVEHRDGSIASSHWNGLTGKQMHPKLLAQVL